MIRARSKPCLRCSRVQPSDCFEANRASLSRDGRSDVCQDCISQIGTAERQEQARQQRVRAALFAAIGKPQSQEF